MNGVVNGEVGAAAVVGRRECGHDAAAVGQVVNGVGDGVDNGVGGGAVADVGQGGMGGAEVADVSASDFENVCGSNSVRGLRSEALRATFMDALASASEFKSNSSSDLDRSSFCLSSLKHDSNLNQNSSVNSDSTSSRASEFNGNLSTDLRNSLCHSTPKHDSNLNQNSPVISDSSSLTNASVIAASNFNCNAISDHDSTNHDLTLQNDSNLEHNSNSIPDLISNHDLNLNAGLGETENDSVQVDSENEVFFTPGNKLTKKTKSRTSPSVKAEKVAGRRRSTRVKKSTQNPDFIYPK